MNLEDQGGIFHRLLLSPLQLLQDILGTLIPGGIFLLLLGFKGLSLVRTVWFELPFGYKTNIAIALVISFTMGKILQLPFALFREQKPTLPDNLKHLSSETRQMLICAVSEGSLSAIPILADKLAVQQADGAFHVGMGICLISAAFFPGDGKLRWLELLIGILFILAALKKIQEYQDAGLRYVGAGIAAVLLRSSKDQLTFGAALWKALGLSGAPIPTAGQAPPAQTSSVPSIPSSSTETASSIPTNTLLPDEPKA